MQMKILLCIYLHDMYYMLYAPLLAFAEECMQETRLLHRVLVFL